MAQESVASLPWLVVLGGSAGSLDVLLSILPGWQPDPRMALVIVLHRKADGDSQLTDLLSSRGSWPVEEAKDKCPVLPGHIYLAPADYHLLIELDHTFSLDYSEKINYSRPSIDATFETAAPAYEDRLICVLLSGANTDGTQGLMVAQEHGAHIVIQQPDTAIAPFMPLHALNGLSANAVLAPDMLVPYLNRLTAR